MLSSYNLICVGAGIANISLALQFLNTDKKVLIIEKGQSLDKRSCPKSFVGKCVKCNPCQITTGFAGAGCFSDCKLTYSPDVGGNLIEYIGKENFSSLLGDVDKMFDDYGASGEGFYDEDFANSLKYECTKYGMNLVKGKVRHLGTDGSFTVMMNIYSQIMQSSNITLMCNTEVEDIDFVNKTVKIKDALLQADKISIAVGRYGSEWLRSICRKNNIKLVNSSVDIGVRVECPRSVTDFITDKLYEFKIINYSSTDNKVRTFCVNPGGYVVQENYDKVVCVNGHSFSDNKSLNTNFALLVSANFTDPFNEPIKYGKRICELANMLADGKPMVQRLIDLKNGKRSTRDRMNRLSIEPTLSNAEPGDLSYVLPTKILNSIIETLDNLNNIMPNINGANTILYAPEVKFYTSKIDLNSNLQNDNYKDIYFIGDSSGVTHGIIQSAMSGLYVAGQIK
jgi:uncharacterized FAD-dependent dehydrogenase